MHDGEEGELAAIGDRFPFLFNRQPGISISKLIYPTSSVKILLTKNSNSVYVASFAESSVVLVAPRGVPGFFLELF